MSRRRALASAAMLTLGITAYVVGGWLAGVPSWAWPTSSGGVAVTRRFPQIAAAIATMAAAVFIAIFVLGGTPA